MVHNNATLWPYLVKTFKISVGRKFQDRAECGNNSSLTLFRRGVSNINMIISLSVMTDYYYSLHDHNNHIMYGV